MSTELAAPKLAAGQVYRSTRTTDPDFALDLVIVRRIKNWGGIPFGLGTIPYPVVGQVWIAEIDVPSVGRSEILCTPEGLVAREFELIEDASQFGSADIAEEPAS